MKTALKFAFKNHLIIRNPFDDIDKPKHTSAERGVLSEDTFELLLAKAKELYGEQWVRLFDFALISGARRGEILALTFPQ